MTPQLATEAIIPNPRLAVFKPFLGTWTTVGHHSMMPGITLNGRASFEWHEGGAFLCVRTDVQEEGIPSAIALIGTDDDDTTFRMMYFDERKVSRQFEVTVDDKTLRWARNAPGFSQRYVLTISNDGNTMHGVSSLSKDDKTWEQDLEMEYTRVK